MTGLLVRQALRHQNLDTWTSILMSARAQYQNYDSNDCHWLDSLAETFLTAETAAAAPTCGSVPDVEAPEERRLHALPLDAQRWEPRERAVCYVVCQEVVDYRRRNDPADVLCLATSVALQQVQEAANTVWWPLIGSGIRAGTSALSTGDESLL